VAETVAVTETETETVTETVTVTENVTETVTVSESESEPETVAESGSVVWIFGPSGFSSSSLNSNEVMQARCSSASLSPSSVLSQPQAPKASSRRVTKAVHARSMATSAGLLWATSGKARASRAPPSGISSDQCATTTRRVRACLRTRLTSSMSCSTRTLTSTSAKSSNTATSRASATCHRFIPR